MAKNNTSDASKTQRVIVGDVIAVVGYSEKTGSDFAILKARIALGDRNYLFPIVPARNSDNDYQVLQDIRQMIIDDIDSLAKESPANDDSDIDSD